VVERVGLVASGFQFLLGLAAVFTEEVGDFCMPSCTRYIQWSTTVFCTSDIKVGTFFDKQFSCLQFASSGGATPELRIVDRHFGVSQAGVGLHELTVFC
jgi:hypothetical protein